GWVIGIVVVALAVLLFSLLDARRRSLSSPSVRERAADSLALAAPPPPLYVPPEAPPEPVFVIPEPAPPPAPAPPPPPPQIIYVPQPVPVPAAPEAPPPPQRTANAPALVFDGGLAQAAEGAPAAAAAETEALPAAAGAAVAGSRTRAGVLANRSTTVPQGALIPAVLETALDSTRAGLARAIVSRDVRGFDGTRVLIPRGSRLIGEYRSDVQPGQRRALVNWIRLIRPDGVTIAIGSPAGDPLGRGGIRARVNSHFFERFAGAILQSALDVGVNLAGRAAGNGTVVVLQGGAQGGAPQIIQPAQITPTLTVRQGTSISIFVARDLDFTGAGGRR
ncbi:MAG TPA: TrbI/VirB10 family protein, partial [Allosphingosinicella sp.]|nr:TrbI/VirB10 family protein [Allosphingosinicella sp.]